ncbi:hypothetical protein Sango_2892000 [Sesamum angolense]|uniref:DUF4218 domain-containing protein n=1 Tax=Sesamum angolense TaxID=2727404 RepID=A0AAE1VZ20_9LAMI|nr:hypothetical protein Sango_2892000 [Sesamum angolense]
MHFLQEFRMHGMKSHECHVFIKKLIPIAFHEMLFEHVWSALIDFSLLFQSICSITMDVHKLHELENSVSIILCNLKKIFSPAFFDSIEHLTVHLSYEAHVGGPVQYRWMYPFERFLHELKKKVKNKTHVEHPLSRHTLSRKSVSIFNYPDRASGATKKIWLSGPERYIKETYILTNCEVVTPYYDKSTMNCGANPARGMKVHLPIIVNVNFKKLYQKDDPFILAQQAVQVYFTEYPSMKRDKANWMVVCKIKARRVVDESKWTETFAYKLEEVISVPVMANDNQSYDLHDPNSLQVVVDFSMAYQQAVGTSRRQARESDDEDEEEDED